MSAIELTVEVTHFLSRRGKKLKYKGVKLEKHMLLFQPETFELATVGHVGSKPNRVNIRRGRGGTKSADWWPGDLLHVLVPAYPGRKV